MCSSLTLIAALCLLEFAYGQLASYGGGAGGGGGGGGPNDFGGGFELYSSLIFPTP